MVARLGQVLVALSLGLCFSTAQASVTSLTCIPATIGGGTGHSSSCTVALSSPAPSGGSVVTLTSSLTELATSVPSITVPAGQTAKNFTVGTNPEYRRYSKLAFSSTITATHNAASKTAVINVTAQALPAVTMISPRPDRSGAVCGVEGILFNCPLGTATCTVKQECTLGCENRPLGRNNTYQDVCATTGVVPIALTPNRIIGGNQGAGKFQVSSPAPADSAGTLANTLFTVVTTNDGLAVPIATGTTSAPFNMNTVAVTGVKFVPMDGGVLTPKPISGGGIFYQRRSARAWLVLTEPPL
jgi:hypothetical protein